MGLCLVTGVSGTGKSALLGELRVRGCLARGVDEDGYADWVSVLSRAAARCGRPVFLCGSAPGEADVRHLSDRLVALVADVPTIERRLAARADDYGKAPEELAMIIGWHDGSEESYRRSGAVIVDARRPLHEVGDEVLAAVGQ